MQKITNLLFDGSSNAKTNNVNELFLIKTCEKDKPTFNVMSLEEMKDSSSHSLKVALEESIGKKCFSFDLK